MNSTAVLSADHGGLSAQQKAVVCYDYIRQGWSPTTSQVAEVFAITFGGASRMLSVISAVMPIYREEPQATNYERGCPSGRWKLLTDDSYSDGTRWNKFDNE